MSDTLSLEISASLSWLFEESLDLSTLTDNARLEYSQLLQDGTAAGEADKIWHDTRTIGVGANDDLDLSALTQSIHGSTVTIGFAKVRAIFLVNTSTTVGEALTLDASVTNALLGPFGGVATSKLELPPDSTLMLVSKIDGWDVSDGSADIIRVTHSASVALTYKVVIVGTSA